MARQPFKWKKSTLAAAAVIALSLAATGTLAALTARSGADRAAGEAAPGVNLHDDFAGGPEKDVYAENSGGEAMLTRIRFTELLRLSDGTILPQGAQDDAAGTLWQRHAPVGGVLADCGFEAHRSFAWTLGGYKAYMPAARSALARGDYTDEKNYTPPMDVGDTLRVIDYAPLLRQAFSDQGNSDALGWLEAWLSGDDTRAQSLQSAIAALPDELTVSGVLQYQGQPEEEQTRRLNEVRLTAIPAQTITMQAWLESGRKLGNFWVMDSDGWCYWANSLSKGQATGLLMRSCEYLEERPTDVIYKIRAELDATTTLPDDINRYLTENDALGDITPEAMELTIMASGSYSYGADGELYIPNEDNTLIHVVKNGDSYANYILGDRICAGADQTPGDADDLKPGQGIAVHKDGTLYRVTNDDSAWLPPTGWAGPYLIQEIVSGENGTAYLALVGGGYCCSVASLDPASSDYLKPTTLGLGPYRLAWPGEDGTIGTADDLYNDDFAAVGDAASAQFYRRLSQKVYVRVARLGDTEPALYLSEDGLYYLDREGNYINESDLSPVAGREGDRYTGKASPLCYAAGERYALLENSTFPLEAMAGDDPAGTAALVYNCLASYDFHFLLGGSFKFAQGSGYLFPADAAYAASTLDLYELTPTGVVRGGDGKFYLRTEVTQENPISRWYIGPGADDVLGTADDERLNAGEDLIIGTADDSADAPSSPLDFLPANFTGKAGDTFTVDGSGWVVLNNDGNGNLLIAATTEDVFGSSRFNAQDKGTVYTGSELESYYQSTVMPMLVRLSGFIQPASIPASGRSVYNASGVRTAFPLSIADVNAYASRLKVNWSFSLRSPSTNPQWPSSAYVDGYNYDNKIMQWEPTGSLPCRPAMIVNFSVPFVLPDDFTGLPGDRLCADGYDWVVLDRDDAGNLMLMTVEQVTEMGARGDTKTSAPAYQETLWVTEGRDAAFTQKLTELGPYARTAVLPVEDRYPYLAPWSTITGGLSACGGSAEGAVAFVPSAGEYSQYIYSAPGMVKYRRNPAGTDNGGGALRSLYAQDAAAPAEQGFAVTVTADGEPLNADPTTDYPPKMALWVNFGPAA